MASDRLALGAAPQPVTPRKKNAVSFLVSPLFLFFCLLSALSPFLSSERSWPSLILVNEFLCVCISLNPDALSPCNILSAFRLSSPFFAEAQHSKRKLLLLTLATFQCSKQTVSRVKGQRWQNGMYLSRYIKEVVQQNEDSSSSELSDNSEDGVYRGLFDDDQTDTAVRSFNSIPYDVLCIGDSNLLIRRGLLDSLWAGYIGLARKWTESAVKH